MRVAVITPNWWFFHDIFEELKQKYHVRAYRDKLTRLFNISYRMGRLAQKMEIFDLMRWSDLTFFDWASNLFQMGTRLPKLCKVLVRVHSYELYDKELLGRIDWSKVNKIITVSEMMKRNLVTLYPECTQKVVVISNYVDVHKFSALPREFGGNLGTLGRIVPIKRIYDLILSFFEIAKDCPNLKLHIGGYPTPDSMRYALSIESLIKKLGLKGKVIMDGHISDPASWYKKIDIYICNSFWEGQSVSLLEAMASGCYTVSHFWDGVEEVLPMGNIYLTHEDLRSKIIQYLNLSQHEKIEKCMRLRRTIAERFSSETLIPKFIKLVNELCGEKFSYV